MSAIFKDEIPFSYHDFDSGDCYLLLAEAYLATGETSKAMSAVEKSVMYYIDLYNRYTGEKVLHRSNIKSPIVSETELITSLPKEIIKQESRFLKLRDIVNNLS